VALDLVSLPVALSFCPSNRVIISENKFVFYSTVLLLAGPKHKLYALSFAILSVFLINKKLLLLIFGMAQYQREKEREKVVLQEKSK